MPDEFRWTSNDPLSQWCVGDHQEPVVARTSVSTLVGCPTRPKDPPPDTLVANTGTIVAFLNTDEKDGTTHQGDRTTVRLDTVEVVVNAPTALRQQIVKTIHRVSVDDYGCPTTHPISAEPSWRPQRPVRIAVIKGVTAIAVCKFDLSSTHTPAAGLRLASSLKLTGEAAVTEIRKLAAAPDGGGPNYPDDCDAAYGDDALVLLVTSESRRSEVVVRYDGCDHLGIDDGLTVRRLTRAAVAPLITGPNEVNSVLDKPEISAILGVS